MAPKNKPTQVQIFEKTYRDPITNRDLCIACFNGNHEGCKPGSKCNCVHLEAKSTPRKKKDPGEQLKFDAGTITV